MIVARKFQGARAQPSIGLMHVPPVLPLLILAFGMRAATLTWQSMWLDEVYSVWFVQGGLAEAWSRGIFPAQNPHAPLYYGALWAWIQLAGVSAFAVRWFSLIAGVAGVAAVWRFVRLVARASRPADVAAFILALSPFAIWYSQEARMYAQYLLFSALALIALWRLLTRPVGAVRALTYIGFATAMAYTHFFGVFTLAAHALIAGGWFVARRHAGHRVRRFWQLFLTLAAIAVLCAPIPLALLGSGRTFDSTDVTRRFVGLLEMTELMTSEFMVRLPLVASVWRYAYLVPVWALFLLGVGVLARNRARLTGLPIGVSHLPQGVMLLALAVAPMIAFLPASLAVPIFTPKYLSSVYPVLLAGLGIGIVAVARWHPPAGRIALAALMSLGAVGHYRDLTNVDVQREQWGYVADVLARHVEPGDKIVVFADYVQPVLEWSYHGPGEIIKFEADPVHPEAFFDAIQQGSFRHLWLVLAHDHAAKIDHRLVEVASVRYPWWRAEYPNQGFIRVLEYALRWRYDALPRDANPANVAFANGVTLVGVTIEEQRVPATDQISHPPSHWVHVRAYWRRTGAIAPEHARPYLKLTSADGGEWGGDLPRIPSVFEFDPPTGWPTDGAGSIIATEHDVNLNPIAPPGAYAVIVGLVHDDGTKVPLSLHPDQFAARLGDVEIVGRK